MSQRPFATQEMGQSSGFCRLSVLKGGSDLQSVILPISLLHDWIGGDPLVVMVHVCMCHRCVLNMYNWREKGKETETESSLRLLTGACVWIRHTKWEEKCWTLWARDTAPQGAGGWLRPWLIQVWRTVTCISLLSSASKQSPLQTRG